MSALQFFSLIAGAVAVVAMIVKAVRYLTAPQHMRWELYPVPHEKGRADYGGSYVEELDWWTKPRRKDMLRELKEMVQEILFLKGVYHHNRRVWTSSFPFHLGLYFTMAWIVLLIIGGAVVSSGGNISAQAGGVGSLIYYMTMVTGYIGLVLAGVGALGLFFWRVSDRAQRGYTSPIDYFNLLLFVVTTVLVLIFHLTQDPSFDLLRSYLGATLTLTPVSSVSLLFSVEVVLLSFLVLWIPLTRMSHFVAKYFLYHSIRWADEPNERGSKLEKSLLKNLALRVDWSAPHIKTGKSWAEAVKEGNDE